MKRLQFIKSSCTACAMLALPGIVALVMESCATMPMVKVKPNTTKTCTVPLEKFVQSNMILLRVNGFEFDLLIVKKSEAEYKTLELRCTHQDQPLTASNKTIFCASHGSTFDLDGNVIKEPALKPLKTYKTEIDKDSLLITLT